MKKLLVLSLLVAYGASNAATTVITDFEAYAAGTTKVMFREPGFSGSTSSYITTTNSAAVSSDVVGSNTSKKYKVQFAWNSGTAGWLRLTTSTTTYLTNTTIDLSQYLQFDIYSNYDIYCGIGVRETNPTGAIGSNGGSSGTIEWLSNVAFTGSPGNGQLIAKNTWTTVTLNLAKAGLAGGPYVKGFTGNGTLTSTTGKAVLEHIYFAPTGVTGPYTIYLDNIRQTTDAVPEPLTLIGLATGLGALIARRRRNN